MAKYKSKIIITIFGVMCSIIVLYHCIIKSSFGKVSTFLYKAHKKTNTIQFFLVNNYLLIKYPYLCSSNILLKMVSDYYTFNSNSDKNLYLFLSEGQTQVVKAVQFTEVRANIFNLGLADFEDGKFNYSINTDNHDARKVLNTVAAILLNFSENHINARILILANEKKRLRLYNRIFQLRLIEIETIFEIIGVVDFLGNKFEIYDSNTNYQGFLLTKK
jgi:hypothetical protein